MTTRIERVHQDELDQGRSRGKTEPTVFDLLQQDHERIRGLFEIIGNSGKEDIKKRQEVFTQIKQELFSHMEGEERFFYAALEQHDESREKVLECFEEHQVVKTVLGAFVSLAVDDERWAAKLKVLRKSVRRHMEEEEQDLFRVAENVLGREQLQGIVTQLRQFGAEAMKS